MATVSRFEDLEIWQLARIQARELFEVYNQGSFSKDFDLKNQLNASSGSVVDCIAEGFERSGNREFFNFLVIAKGSNGEVRSQLYRAFDRKYISDQQLVFLNGKNETISNKITSFMKYLKGSDRRGFRYE